MKMPYELRIMPSNNLILMGESGALGLFDFLDSLTRCQLPIAAL
jgi:hypothetical protein